MKPTELTLAILIFLKPETNKQKASVGKQNRTNQSSSLSKDQGGVRKLHSLKRLPQLFSSLPRLSWRTMRAGDTTIVQEGYKLHRSEDKLFGVKR